METSVNLLVDNGGVFAYGYDFVFAANGYHPDMYFNDEWRVADNSKGWTPNYCQNSVEEKVGSQIAKCMLMAFKEYMK